MEAVLDRHLAFDAFRGVRVFAGWSPDAVWRQVPDPERLRRPALAGLAGALEVTAPFSRRSGDAGATAAAC